MRKLDLLTALIVVISVIIFIKPKSVGQNEVGLTSIEVIEGPVIPDGGRNGTARISFFNPTTNTLECEVHIDISQFFLGTLFEADIVIEFEPNTTVHELPLFLPNGDNKVVIDATC